LVQLLFDTIFDRNGFSKTTKNFPKLFVQTQENEMLAFAITLTPPVLASCTESTC